MRICPHATILVPLTYPKSVSNAPYSFPVYGPASLTDDGSSLVPARQQETSRRPDEFARERLSVPIRKMTATRIQHNAPLPLDQRCLNHRMPVAGNPLMLHHKRTHARRVNTAIKSVSISHPYVIRLLRISLMSCSSNMVYCLIIISIWKRLNHPRFSTKMSSSEKTPLIKTLTLNPVSLVASRAGHHICADTDLF